MLQKIRKAMQDKSNNQPKSTTIFNELINKRKKTMSKLYGSVDYNNLKFEYVSKVFMSIWIVKNFLMQ